MRRTLAYLLCVALLLGLPAEGTRVWETPSKLATSLKIYEVVHVEIEGDGAHALSSGYHHTLKVAFESKGQYMKLELQRNDKLFHPNYFEVEDHYLDGKRVARQQKGLSEDHQCHYKGTILSTDGGEIQNGRVRLSNCRGSGLKGLLFGDETLALEPAHKHLDKALLEAHLTRLKRTLSNSNQHKSLPTLESMHLLYKHEVSEDERKWRCGVTDDDQHQHYHDGAGEKIRENKDGHNKGDLPEDLLNFLSASRARLLSSKPVEEHEHRRLLADPLWVELFVVNDKSRLLAKGDAANAMESSAHMANLVDGLYELSNLDPPVKVVVTHQWVFPEEDPWQAKMVMVGGEVDHKVLLEEFHIWREEIRLFENLHFDNGQLFSHLDFKGSTVGYASVGQMCQMYSGGINQMAFSDDAKNAAIVAHEMGHNFGMLHDDSPDPNWGNACPESGYIMNAVLGITPDVFSSCSKAYYVDSLSRTSTCLTNIPEVQWTNGTSQCGNGYVEGDETCDCGTTDTSKCMDPCCDAAVCQLKANADCSDTDKCCKNCKVVKVSEALVCRNASGACDVAESCDGSSPTCPVDVFVGSGRPCFSELAGNDVAGLCFGGQCKSKSKQCFDMSAGGECSFSGVLDIITQANMDPCGDLICQVDTDGSCSKFQDGIDGEYVQAEDGVRCGDNYQQCSAGKCVDSRYLTRNFEWVQSDFSACLSCDEKQYSTVDCMYRNPKTLRLEQASQVELCSPNALMKTSRNCMNATLECLHANDETWMHTAARQWADIFDADDKARWLRGLVPRLYGPLDFQPTNSQYWIGIGLIGIPSGVLALGSLIYGLFYCMCGCGCGSKNPDPEGYTNMQKYVPWTVIMCLIGVSVAFACLGLFYSGELHRGITNENVGVVDLIDGLLTEAKQNVRMLSVPLSYFIENSTIRLAETDVLVKGAKTKVDLVGDLLTETSALYDVVKDTLNDSTSWSVQLGPSSEDLGPAVVAMCAKCDILTGKVADVDASMVEATMVYNAQHHTFDAFHQQFSVLKIQTDTFYSESSPAQESLHSMQKFLGDLAIELEGEDALVGKYKNTIKDAEMYRHPIVMGLFFMPFVFAIVTSIAPVCVIFLKHSGFLTWTLLIIMWLLLGVHLPLATTFGDSCTYFDKNEDALAQGTFFEEASLNTAGMACLAGISMIDALNLTDLFLVPFAARPPTLVINLEALEDLRVWSAEVSMLTEMDLGINTSAWADEVLTLLQEINMDMGTTYTIDTLANFDSSNATAALQASKWRALSLAQAQVEASARFMALKTNASKVSGLISASAAAGRQAGTMMTMDPLEKLVTMSDSLAFSATCRNLGASYQLFKASWCGIITTSISFLALSCLCLGIFAGPLIFLSKMLSKRFSHDGDRGKIGGAEGYYGQQEMSTVERRQPRLPDLQGERENDGAIEE